MAENIEEESKGTVVHNFEYIYFPRGVVHALTRISGILYTCLTFRIKVSSSTMEVEVYTPVGCIQPAHDRLNWRHVKRCVNAGLKKCKHRHTHLPSIPSILPPSLNYTKN